MEKLSTLLLLNVTLLFILLVCVIVYQQWYVWLVRRTSISRRGWSQVLSVLRVVGLLWLCAGVIIQIRAGYWNDPWPINDAYATYVVRWLTSWLVILLPGLPAFYRLSIATRGLHAHHADGVVNAAIGIAVTTLTLLTCLLLIATPWSVRLFWGL